jgi:hypothetical protein
LPGLRGDEAGNTGKGVPDPVGVSEAPVTGGLPVVGSSETLLSGVASPGGVEFGRGGEPELGDAAVDPVAAGFREASASGLVWAGVLGTVVGDWGSRRTGSIVGFSAVAFGWGLVTAGLAGGVAGREPGADGPTGRFRLAVASLLVVV